MRKGFLVAASAGFLGYALPVQAQELSHNDLLKKGEYLARAADCSACHSMPGKAAYGGGVAFRLPIGRIYSSNITPDPVHGIGRYTEQQFGNALRKGIRRDGATLYPAMPFPSYARLSDADVHALFVYFREGVHPSTDQPPATTIPWPLSMRWPLAFWRYAFAPSPQAALRRTTERSFLDPQIARGAWLVEGPAHCGACHTPRAMTMQEKALTAADGPLYLSGGTQVDGWVPPSLRQENRTGLGRWSEEDIVSFLRSGRAQPGLAFGGMTDAVRHGTQFLTDADLHAIAQFLRSLPPAAAPDPAWVYDGTETAALRRADVRAKGAQLYVDSCAACHRTDGRGYPAVFPPLAGNPVVMSTDPASLVQLLCRGATLPGMNAAPSSFTMPAFYGRLSRSEMADVLTFIRHAWGNNAPAVSASAVTCPAPDVPMAPLQPGQQH